MFTFNNKKLYCEQLPLSFLAEKYGTPLYVYSLDQINFNIDKVKGVFDTSCPEGLVCYAVKANSHLALLRYLADRGFGFDVVSHGEMLRILEVQGHLNNTVYSGSAKTKEDIYEAVKHGIFMLNAESLWEVKQASQAAQKLSKHVFVSLRVNPSVDPRTHKHISTGVLGAKFGISKEEIFTIAQEVLSMPNVILKGLSCHIGSMVDGDAPFMEMLDVLTELADTLKNKGIPLTYIDLGGGFPIRYTNEKEINYKFLFDTYHEVLHSRALKPIIEPGRSIIGNTAVLLSRVVHIKESHSKRFAFLDAGFTELIRPALYEAFHDIIPVDPQGVVQDYTVAGPICESTDVFAENISLALEEGALLALENAGAYGYCMSLNYNTRPKAAEVLVDKAKDILITKRESYTELWRNEKQKF